MRKLFIVLLCAIATSLSAQKVYYVQPLSENSKASDSNKGTDINYPWRTWQKAVSVAQPGDTVYFRGGVYPVAETNGNGVVWDPTYSHLGLGYSGTRDNYIHYFNYPVNVMINLSFQRFLQTHIYFSVF